MIHMQTSSLTTD
uniref:Uncharacterized protein n=1 Tax=Arundo donax TaxID=35708 RepID=A0A0A9EFP1_ARUDO